MDGKLDYKFEFSDTSYISTKKQVGRSRGSSVSIETSLGAVRPVFNSRQEQWGDIFLSAMASRSALGPTQPPIQWVSRG
jgi:hypothetical protein